MLNVLGVLLTAHTLICSGYLIHECVHNTVAASVRANDRLGMLLTWFERCLPGRLSAVEKKAPAAPYRPARRSHIRLSRGPQSLTGWIQRGVLALEWAYVPAVELMMRGMIIAFPFHDGTARERARVLVLLTIRVLFFAGLP